MEVTGRALSSFSAVQATSTPAVARPTSSLATASCPYTWRKYYIILSIFSNIELVIILVTRGTRVSASTRLPLMRKLSLGQGLPPPDAQVSLAAAAVARSEHKEPVLSGSPLT